MTSQSLYRKWRSRSFGDILGQGHVIQTLQNAVRHDRVAHAYLFTGPRGTGKTSTARVMAKAVNCLNPSDGVPCGECALCLSIAAGRSPDIVEIDGASNTGIDDIRALRERAAYAPAEGRFKVYIIDEVHRLSGNAFDGLLKTLEEPPPHVLFIFASTEPHKVPTTILSRCQRFDFHRIDRVTTIARLREVANEEGMTLDEAAYTLIAQQAGGSLRDALGILDQVRAFAGDAINGDDVRSSIGLGRPEIVASLSESIVSADPGHALQVIREGTEQGIDPRTLLRQLVEYWRELLLFVAGSNANDNLDPLLADAARKQAGLVSAADVIAVLRALTEEVIEPRLSVSPELPLEIGVVRATLLVHGAPGSTGNPVPDGRESAPERTVRERSEPDVEMTSPVQPEPVLAATAPSGKVDSGAVSESKDETSFPSAEVATSPPTDVIPPPRSSNRAVVDLPAQADNDQSPIDRGFADHPSTGVTQDMSSRLNDAWPLVIDAAGARSKTLQGLLRGVADKSVVDSEVTLGFHWPFHRDQSDKPENRAMTERIIEEIIGTKLRVRCVRVDSAGVAAPDDENDAFAADVERALRSVHAQQFRSSKPDG